MEFIFFFLVFAMTNEASTSVPDITDFFKEIENDLSRVTWGHAINSKALLEDALNESIMMLEADVREGHIVNETSPSKKIPIMAHPPNNTSDISLEMWIDRVIEANEEGKKTGVKLDFKELNVILTSLEILRKKSSMLNFPLWLNADILKGPGGEKKTPVDADIFLSLCTEFFPDATLSLGWTTGYISGTKQKYTNEMIDAMVETLDKNNVDQPVTFPIRAAFVGASFEELENLYIDKPDYTFTIWTSATDNVSIEDLAKFQNALGANSVSFDLPEKQMKQLRTVHDSLHKTESSSHPNYNLSVLCAVIGCLIISLIGAYFR